MEQQEEKVTAHQKIRKFISRYAKPAGLFLIGVLVLFIAVEIYNYAKDKQIEKATVAIEDIQDRFAEAVKALGDAEPTLDKCQSYIDDLDRVYKKYPKEYAGHRALFMKADILYTVKDFEKAASCYKEFAAKYPKSYDAPIAIFNTGACYEGAGKLAEAEAEYLKVLNNYVGSYAFMPKLIFTLGRVCELSQRYADAEKYYNQLADKYSGSSYYLYAQDRIILMKAKGQL